MSHGPSTFGTMITSSFSPISVTTDVMSSSTHGDSSEFTRVHSCVSPSSISRPTRSSPSRAASLRSTGTASSRLPSRMSTVGAMSGTLATIFSLEKSRKWIIREGLNGISRSGSGGSMASGLKKSRGLRMAGDLTIRRLMSTETTTGFTTDQREREASGAHSYGRYLEDFEVCAGKSQQGRNVVVGPLVYSLALGMSVSDVSGKAIANLATEELSHPAPVFHGDTLFVESEVLEKRESRSKPDRGTVKVHTRVFNQDGTLVAEFKRLVLVPRKTPGTPE